MPGHLRHLLLPGAAQPQAARRPARAKRKGAAAQRARHRDGRCRRRCRCRRPPGRAWLGLCGRRAGVGVSVGRTRGSAGVTRLAVFRRPAPDGPAPDGPAPDGPALTGRGRRADEHLSVLLFQCHSPLPRRDPPRRLCRRPSPRFSSPQHLCPRYHVCSRVIFAGAR